VIRPAREDEGPALEALMHASNGYSTPEQRRLIERVRVPVGEGALTFVHADAAGLGGFYTLLQHAGGRWEIDLFFTANDRQGSGLGRALFAHAAAEAARRGGRELLIVSNPPAAGFYRRMGAREDGVDAPRPDIPWERPRFVLPLTAVINR
jgi:GNAT superfamily N-acetyltransferase